MKQILFTTAFLVQTIIFAQVPTGSLVGYWPFSGNANDMSGNSNNGAVSGATLTNDRFGNCNMAYSFDGTNNKIVVTNTASIDMSNSTDFAVCFWMNTAPGATLPITMISKNQYGSVSGYEFFSSTAGYCNAVTGQMSWYTAGTQASCSNTNICLGSNQGTWIFVVGMYNGATNTGSNYINGVLQNATSFRTANLSTAVDLYFGCQSNSSEFYKGMLDDIRIYKRLLNQSEITALYNEANPVSPLTATNTTPPANQTVCAGNAATLSAACGTNSINWYSSPTSTVPVGTGTSYVTPTLASGTYTYYVRGVDDCTGPGTMITAITFTVSDCTGIKSYQQNELAANLYPNPNQGQITVEVSEPATLVLSNIYGQQLVSQKLQSGANSIDLSEFAKGIYFAQIKRGDATRTYKIVRDE
jgi:hypothetical protein